MGVSLLNATEISPLNFVDNRSGTLLARINASFAQLGGYESVTKKICLFTIPLIAALGVGCQTTTSQEAANANTAANQAQPGPDNSEITTTVDANGTRTETRTFKNNPRVSKVVVTTHDGKKTVKVTSPSGEEKVVDTTEDVLHATGDKVADAAGFVADKSEDVAGETKDKTKDVVDKSKDIGDKVVDKSKDVGGKAVDTSKTVGEKGVEGAKKVGTETVKGAKKAGSAVKKVIP